MVAPLPSRSPGDQVPRLKWLQEYCPHNSLSLHAVARYCTLLHAIARGCTRLHVVCMLQTQHTHSTLLHNCKFSSGIVRQTLQFGAGREMVPLEAACIRPDCSHIILATNCCTYSATSTTIESVSEIARLESKANQTIMYSLPHSPCYQYEYQKLSHY